ncbi:MAG: hypothetical protein Q7S26_04140 [bacterium]|nr:hypothetical protein [bacterium]
MNKYLLVGVLILLVGAGGLIYMHRPTENTDNTIIGHAGTLEKDNGQGIVPSISCVPNGDTARVFKTANLSSQDTSVKFSALKSANFSAVAMHLDRSGDFIKVDLYDGGHNGEVIGFANVYILPTEWICSGD